MTHYFCSSFTSEERKPYVLRRAIGVVCRKSKPGHVDGRKSNVWSTYLHISVVCCAYNQVDTRNLEQMWTFASKKIAQSKGTGLERIVG